MAENACNRCGCAFAECECSERNATKRSTPYQRIMRAAKRGTGVRLTADDVRRMSIDTAIVELAMNDDEGHEDT